MRAFHLEGVGDADRLDGYVGAAEHVDCGQRLHLLESFGKE